MFARCTTWIIIAILASPAVCPAVERGPLLGELMKGTSDSATRMMPEVAGMKIDEAKVKAEGIRKISGTRLTLYTDVADEAKIDQLPGLFDQAFPQWCEYFGIDPAKHADWHATACLIREKGAFVRAGLIPRELPPFTNGYARNYELWLYDQTADYYRRHLLLHEGTHAFMLTVLGGCGPAWYMEGMAEMLATHKIEDGKLTLNYMPADQEEVRGLGRIEMVQKAVEERRALRLDKVLELTHSKFADNESYAWSWALAAMLDRSPRYKERFHQISADVLKPKFTERFFSLLGDDARLLPEDWQLTVMGLEYGHDMAATLVDYSPGKPLPEGGTTVKVAADRGWQNSGVKIEAGTKYKLEASGRFQVADEPKIWWSEPNGVSIRYYKGRPLGLLLAAVRPDKQTSGSSALLRPAVIGPGISFTAKQSGTLFFKINESAGELGDNAGSLSVKITAQ